jgi:hypothetical protein
VAPRNPKQSGKKEASEAGKTLADPTTSAKDKRLAASVLSQAPPAKPQPNPAPKRKKK